MAAQSWGVAGFLLGSGTAVITDDGKQRVADEIKTTFSTTYSQRLTLEQMLDPLAMADYQAQRSNEKSLVTPQSLTANL